MSVDLTTADIVGGLPVNFGRVSVGYRSGIGQVSVGYLTHISRISTDLLAYKSVKFDRSIALTGFFE